MKVFLLHNPFCTRARPVVKNEQKEQMNNKFFRMKHNNNKI